MGLTLLDGFLRRHHRIGLDTNVFIYHLEGHPKHLASTDRIFAWFELPGRTAVTSTITMTELLVQPYRAANERLVDECYALLTTVPNLSWVPPTLEIADTAARIRAAYRLKTPDALQAATAVRSAATGFITNDLAFDQVGQFETLLLDRLL